MTRPREEQRFIAFCFLTDALLFWFALNLATLTRLHTLVYVEMWRLQVDRLVCVALFAAGALAAGAYDLSRLGDRFDAMYYMWGGLALTGVMEMLIVAFVPVELRTISRRELMLGLVGGAAFLSVWRYAASGLVARFATLHRTFYVLGREADANRLAEALARDQGARVNAERATIDTLKERGSELAFADAIVALAQDGRGADLEALAFCEEHCRRVFLYPSLDDARLFRHGVVHAIGGIPLIELPGSVDTAPYLYLKRVIDLSAALAGLLLASPIAMMTAAAIKSTSRGKVLYAQDRMGKDGRVFRLYKFRSMVQDAEKATGPVWASAQDARVTPVGRFIRKHRIDEIPQLVNVLKGDMSLIGPRPERPEFHEEFLKQWPLFDKRLAVRPGLTSLSHVLGSYGSNPEDRLRYDLIYIGNLSLFTDLRILISTVRIVLAGKGAR